ncbi:uncharacterized protein involved in exopolysaccharide biosynthesis [Haloferula luteola]|uniref:Uncharacterized protein involved in exopolysaccharide biosynthesis n=1 Tax=Haloferula luteola TaxID=595692 RepID=A0A840V0M3_9BACT|nr:hypothetical protein [Haloferula luteola]MBB5350873.1 uncharacterized protein involved in exopolysaccharide biosynthesis [Haloferula luteola]
MSPPGLQLPGADGTESAAPPPASATPPAPKFRFPIAVDPIRLLAGILNRWPWILVGMIVFGVIGAFVGKLITHQTFSLSVALIKRRVPQNVQTSEIGQSFRPADLNDSTLLATLLSGEPLDLALQKSGNNLSPSQISSHVEASQLDTTDIFYITYHSPIGVNDALRFTGIWATEICEYTKRLQQTEARGVLVLLAKEVAGLEKQIDETNQEILAFCQKNDFVGGESQVAAVLSQLSQIDLQLEDARTSEKALQAKLANLDEQIRHQSPLELRMREAREELANLRSTYTDENPLVQAKIESIRYLEGQLTDLGDGQNVPLDAFTGTSLGNQLYLDIVAARNDLIQATSRIQSLEALRAKTSQRLAEFPAIISNYDALRKKRDSRIQELTLMSNRRKEAEIFATGSPGYWQIFQPPDARKIIPSSRLKKPLLLGGAGSLAGAGFTMALCLLFTHRSTRRSALECCATTRAPLFYALPQGAGEAVSADYQDFWLANLSRALSRRGTLLIWTDAVDPATERDFWRSLGRAMKDDASEPIPVVDFTPDSLWSGQAAPEGLLWTSELSEGSVKLLRASGLPALPDRDILTELEGWLALIRGDKHSLRDYQETAHLATAYLPPCQGTLVILEPAKGLFRVLADKLSLLVTRQLS